MALPVESSCRQRPIGRWAPSQSAYLAACEHARIHGVELSQLFDHAGYHELFQHGVDGGAVVSEETNRMPLACHRHAVRKSRASGQRAVARTPFLGFCVIIWHASVDERRLPPGLALALLPEAAGSNATDGPTTELFDQLARRGAQGVITGRNIPLGVPQAPDDCGSGTTAEVARQRKSLLAVRYTRRDTLRHRSREAGAHIRLRQVKVQLAHNPPS